MKKILCVIMLFFICGCGDKDDDVYLEPIIIEKEETTITAFSYVNKIISRIDINENNFVVSLEKGFNYKTGDYIVIIEEKNEEDKLLALYRLDNKSVTNLEIEDVDFSINKLNDVDKEENVVAVILPKEKAGEFLRDIDMPSSILEKNIKNINNLNIEVSKDHMFTIGESLFTVLMTWDENKQINFDYYEIEIEGLRKVFTPYNYYHFIVREPNKLYDIKIRSVSKDGNKSEWTKRELLTPRDNSYSPAGKLPIPAYDDVVFTGAAYNNIINHLDKDLSSTVNITLKPSLYYNTGSKIVLMDNKNNIVGEYKLTEGEVSSLRIEPYNVSVDITEYLSQYDNSDEVIKLYLKLTNQNGEVISNYSKYIMIKTYNQTPPHPEISYNSVIDTFYTKDYSSRITLLSSYFYQAGDKIEVIDYYNSIIFTKELTEEDMYYLRSNNLVFNVDISSLDKGYTVRFKNYFLELTKTYELVNINEQYIFNQITINELRGSISGSSYSIDFINNNDEEVIITLPKSNYYHEGLYLVVENKEYHYKELFPITKEWIEEINNNNLTKSLSIANLFDKINSDYYSNTLTLQAYISNDGSIGNNRCVNISEVVINGN